MNYDRIIEFSKKLFMKGKIPVTYTINSKMFESFINHLINVDKNTDDEVVKRFHNYLNNYKTNKHTISFNLFNNLTVNINISDKLQDGEIEYKFIYLSDYNFKNQDLQKSDKLQTMTTIYA